MRVFHIKYDSVQIFLTSSSSSKLGLVLGRLEGITLARIVWIGLLDPAGLLFRKTWQALPGAFTRCLAHLAASSLVAGASLSFVCGSFFFFVLGSSSHSVCSN